MTRSAPSPRRGDVQVDSLADARAFTLGDVEIAQLLAEQFECTFCWTNSAGEPVALTEAFIHAEGAIWLCAEESRVRVKAIVRDPRSCVVVSSWALRWAIRSRCRSKESVRSSATASGFCGFWPRSPNATTRTTNRRSRPMPARPTILAAS